MAGLANFALVSNSAASAHGPVKFNTITFTGVSSYTTGGDTGLVAGLRVLTEDNRLPVCVLEEGSVGDFALVWIPASGATVEKLKVVVRSTGAEVASTTDLSSKTFRATVISQ